jgi:hypothetical protein
VADIPDIEPVIAALKARLDEDLPTAVDTVNATVTDGTLIEQPQQILDYIPHPGILTAYPTIGISEGIGRWADDIGVEVTGLHELSIVAFLQADDQQTLVRQLRRTRAAILACVMDGRVLEDATDPTRNRAWGVLLRQIIPGPSLEVTTPEQVVWWMSWVRIVIEARSDSAWD